jgi:hypothetical protein
MAKSKADKQEELKNKLTTVLEDEELDTDDIDKGMAEESKEHPMLSKVTIKQLVMDHLKIDEDYYEPKEEKEDKKEKE